MVLNDPSHANKCDMEIFLRTDLSKIKKTYSTRKFLSALIRNI